MDSFIIFSVITIDITSPHPKQLLHERRRFFEIALPLLRVTAPCAWCIPKRLCKHSQYFIFILDHSMDSHNVHIRILSSSPSFTHIWQSLCLLYQYIMFMFPCCGVCLCCIGHINISNKYKELQETIRS
jgi:hypothetical protein